MTDSRIYMVEPQHITVARDTRQRQENIKDIEDLKQSIARIGIINAIVVSVADDKYTLVAGERRLRAALELGLTQVPIRIFEGLSPSEREVIELEENIKRKELTWRDQVRAIGRLHEIYKARDENWKIDQTAEQVSLQRMQVGKILHVYAALGSDKLNLADGIEHAYNILQRFAERRAEAMVGDIISKGAAIFGNVAGSAAGSAAGAETAKAAEGSVTPPPITNNCASTVASSTLDASENNSANVIAQPTTAPPPQTSAYTPPADPIICADFHKWASTYNGPKFSLIHCDFPYGNYRGDDSKGALSQIGAGDEFYDNHEEIYWKLLDTLTSNLDRIMSYSAHMIFWFNMNFYIQTVTKLRAAGLFVHDHPLIWHKTGGAGGLGVVPGTAVTYPRRTYDTALLAVRGKRTLAKPGSNSYAAPTIGNKIHPSQKPEPMLRAFLSMVVDETSSVFDPTCGSAAALRVAEDLGARSILGLELDPNYAELANKKTLQARVLRQAGSLRREEDNGHANLL